VRPRPMFFHCHLLPLRLVQSHRAKVLPLALLLSLFSGVDDGDARGEQEQFLDLGGAKDLVGSSVFFWLYKVFCASWWTAVPVLVSYVPVFVRSCVCFSSGIIQVRMLMLSKRKEKFREFEKRLSSCRPCRATTRTLQSTDAMEHTDRGRLEFCFFF